MGIILLAKCYTGDEEKFKVYSTADEKIYFVTEKQLATVHKDLRDNFRVKANGKICSKPIVFKPSIIRNDEVIERHDAIIGINDDCSEVKIIKINDRIVTLSIEEFLEKRKAHEFNNEFVHKHGGERYILWKHYAREGQDIHDKNLVIEYINDDTTEVVEKQLDINIESNIKYTDKKNSNTAEFDIKAEIERIEMEESSIMENSHTNENNQNTSAINDYINIIWNMYPNDRITIPMELYDKYSSVILRVLDSSVDGMKRISLSKIFKQDRSKCTYALVSENMVDNIVTVQVLGQSDIPEKSLETDLEGLCLRYASWLRQTKYIKLN